MRSPVAAGAIAALLATTLPAGAPAAAAALPPERSASALLDGLAPVAEHSRRYRDWDDDDGIDAGDVIAGVAVIGAIAAMAGVFDDRDEPRRVPVDARGRADEERSGLARAVDMCVAEVERGRVRVTGVDEATRDASGWRVSGETDEGRRFDCRISNDGRIDAVDTDETGVRYRSAMAGGAVEQYSDAVYARARTEQDGSAVPALPSDAYSADPYSDDPRPAYPGGPLPGEEGYDDYVSGGSQVSYRGD
jgi:hypothetical protein